MSLYTIILLLRSSLQTSEVHEVESLFIHSMLLQISLIRSRRCAKGHSSHSASPTRSGISRKAKQDDNFNGTFLCAVFIISDDCTDSARGCDNGKLRLYSPSNIVYPTFDGEVEVHGDVCVLFVPPVTAIPLRMNQYLSI